MRFVLAAAIGVVALAAPSPAWADGPAPGLVAAYAFDEGSGSVATDASGNGHAGTIAGATWTSGRYGGALSFNGVDASVSLGGLGTFYQGGFTVEAWVQKQSALENDVAVVGTWTSSGGGPMLWVDHLATRYHLTLGSSISGYLDSGRTPVAGQWQHLAATFDGTTARFYLDGTEVASRASSGPVGTSNVWRIGAYGSSAGGFFDGLVDNVRIYDRALTATEVRNDMSLAVSVASATAPTTPGGVSVVGRNQTAVWTGWSPSTDDVAVTGYRVYLNGAPVGTTAETAFTFTGLSCSTSYELGVEALDGSGNASPRARVTASTALCDDATGLVAAYAFEEGSGAVATDASGNGRSGTINGATWGTGRFGGGLSFNGTNAYVDLGALGTFYQGAFTYEAWVLKQSAERKDVAVVGTWTGSQGGPMLWVDHAAGRYQLTLGTSLGGYLDSTATPAGGRWQHIAATFDGATARFYIDGVEKAARTPASAVGSSNSWRIGAYGSVPTGFFDGLIDDVRIYGRALGAGEIQVDMNQPVTSVDAAPQTPPGTPADTTPPLVSLTSPTGGTVSGATTVTANASDDQGWAAVRFKLDGRDLGAEDRSSPYSVPWDTRGELNGSHTLSAVARDRSGNSATTADVVVNVSNAGVSAVGLRAAYGLDEAAGTTVPDSSVNHRTATLVGGAWTTSGRFAGAASFSGTGGRIDLPALGKFYRSGFTYEAWVFKQSTKTDAAVVGTWASGQKGGTMIWVDHVNGRYRLTLGDNFADYLDSARTPAVGRWEHVAATFDGTVARFYVDGVETAAKSFQGNVGNSDTWRIGSYGTSPIGFFDGLIDNVRIYDRPLTGDEIRTDLASRVQPDRTPPAVTAVTPVNGAKDVGIAAAVKATFDEPMQAATLTPTTFLLKDDAGRTIPASVTYDEASKVATLSPQEALRFGSEYDAVLPAGGARDLAGNSFAADYTWSYTTQAAPPPVLVVGSVGNRFGSYLGEILRAEGLNAFTTIDVAFVSPSLLAQFDVVLLGETPLTAAQVTALTGWVQNGGNLIAMRPDKQLAGLVGLSDAGGTLSNAYLKVATAGGPGAGIVADTIQYHGTADRYTLNGATAVATLYSTATTATANPAVTLRSVGTSGGQAAAFTYDLPRSVVYTRQGNPAWAGQERDGAVGIRPDDMFFGGTQTDWLDTSKIAIPQADEQQRLLLNLITQMERDKLPLPRFWYLPRGEKAAVVMSGDDHSPVQSSGGTAVAFDRFKQLSPAGCVVANWECVRSTSYTYPDSVFSNAQAAAYLADGFEIALHPVVSSCPASPISEAQLAAVYDAQLASWRAKYTSQPGPVSSRTHCVFWPDWVSNAKIELARGIRMDANYYHYPGSWIGPKNGFMTGGGFPMRFADVDGTTIDTYQQNTNVNDEVTQDAGGSVGKLLDAALGAQGYFGTFGINMHADSPTPHPGADAIVLAAQSRHVPVISYKQLLDWTDGRDSSSIRGLSWNAGTLTFVTEIAGGAAGLQTLLPTAGPTGTLTTLTCGGTARPYTRVTIKGIEYGQFAAAAGVCEAAYS